MPIQNRLTRVAVAKQTAKGAAAATGTFQLGVNSGSIAGLELGEEELPITWASRQVQGFDRTTAYPTSQWETLALPLSVGTLLHGVCGTDAVTGTGPYVHTIKYANALPYHTVFAQRDAEYFQIDDARISELELSWELTGALKVKVTYGGCVYTFRGTAYTATTDERPQAGLLKGCGGTFTVNGAAAVVKGGSIKISNSVEPVYGSDSVLPKDVFPATHKVDVSLTLIPENLQEFRRVVTGTTSGSAVQCTPFYGSAVTQWRVDANNHLTFNANRLRSVIAFPDTQAAGGPVELALEGSIAEPSGSDSYTFVLSNTQSAAY